MRAEAYRVSPVEGRADAHNQELVLGHVTFVLQQLFQISLERGLCLNHRIERLLDLGRQIICIDVLPLQFFPWHHVGDNGCGQKPQHAVLTAARCAEAAVWGMRCCHVATMTSHIFFPITEV
jgi:hypothetical protein